MSDIEILLLGYALGAVPTYKSSQILVAWMAKRLDVKPDQIENYQEATTDSEPDRQG